jgi:hypothetical protein
MSSTEAPSLMERYARATRTSDLLLRETRVGDADVLLAAGYAARNNERGRQALMLNRMLFTGDYNRLDVMVEYSYRWLKSEIVRARRNGLPMVNRKDGLDVCAVTLRWWLQKVCPACEGRRLELVYPGAQVTSTRACGTCDGHGRIDLDALVRRSGYAKHLESARWLASEFDTCIDMIERDMRAALARGEKR